MVEGGNFGGDYYLVVKGGWVFVVVVDWNDWWDDFGCFNFGVILVDCC